MENNRRRDSMTFSMLFHELAKQYKQKTAVIGGGKSYSYQELDEYSNDLAWWLLRENDLKNEEIVAISMGRSADILIAILGIWKAGGAYIFLDVSYPKSRNAYLFEETGCRITISEALLRDIGLKRETQLVDRSERKGLAALIYTSGSTSLPKGVMIEHENVMRSAGNSFRLGNCRGEDIASVFPSYSFVASIHDTFGTLYYGGTVDIIPEEYRRKVGLIEEYCIRHHITMTYLPPHMARKLLEDNNPGLSLRTLLVGGEIVRNVPTDVIPIINVYAASETCSLAVCCEIPAEGVCSGPLPIGKPNPDMKAYIVDENGDQVARGEHGELWLSGPQIARGYYKRPKETAEHFKSNPFCQDPGYERVFCTGDIVHELKDGNMVYDGRSDNMLKIRGFRVEAGAVESAILENAPVNEVVATSFTDAGGTEILCAYFTADIDIDVKHLKKKLRGVVPYYMIPAALIRLPEMPVNMNKKIDRKALVPPKELDDHKKLEELY